MGARDHTPTFPAGLEARECFEAYATARRHVEHAEQQLTDALAAAEAAGCDRPFLAGVDLARRRLTREEARKDTTFHHLAASLPAHAVFWFLQDDG